MTIGTAVLLLGLLVLGALWVRRRGKPDPAPDASSAAQARKDVAAADEKAATELKTDALDDLNARLRKARGGP